MAVSTVGFFHYPTGREGAEKLGYDATIITAAPAPLLDSFCGVGNPFSLGTIKEGDQLLDFGCGAGFDMYVAARLVGKQGLVCGLDLTEAMLNRAREHLRLAGIAHCQCHLAREEIIPYGNDLFDVVISNGVINLCPDKEACLAELFRVLKPGGRLQFADVIMAKEQPLPQAASVEAWAH